MVAEEREGALLLTGWTQCTAPGPRLALGPSRETPQPAG